MSTAQEAHAAYEAALDAIEKCKATNGNTLNLDGYGLERVPSQIGQLKELTSLSITGNRLTQLPDGILNLKKLSKLSLDNNRFTSLPTNITKLVELKELSFSANELRRVPKEIGALIKLKELDLGENQLEVLPEEIGQLKSLVILALRANRLTKLPNGFVLLTALEALILDDNNIISVPLQLCQLTSLQYLHLHYNQIVTLPPEIGRLKNLRDLNLESNRLKSLPQELRTLNNLSKLLLHGNQDLGLPDELLKYDTLYLKGNSTFGPQNILNYYFDADKELLEARIIVIGDGEVGKTSLIQQLLRRRKASRKQETTRDVVIEQWKPIIRGKKVHINVWDFGGQEPMHAAHPYFFTERTLYLVVASARETGVEERLGYWLRLVAAHSGGARALVVVNKVDQHPMDLDRRGICHEHKALPENPAQAFHATACIDGTGIAQLKQSILYELGQMDQIWKRTPSAWFDVKKRVSKMRENNEDTLDFSNWKAICTDAGIKTEDERDGLLDLLRALGLVVSFPNVPELRPLGVLNPEWVTRAIYPLLTSPDLAASGGLLKLDDLSRLLDPDRYPKERHTWLVGLLKRFELLFADDAGRLLLPARLPKETPDWALDSKWEDPSVLSLELRYPVLPESVISRFIVRMHQDSSSSGTWWRHGIGLRDNECYALVRAFITEGRMQLKILGPKAQRRQFVGRLRGQLQDLGRNLVGGDLYVILAEGLAEKYTDLLQLAEKELVIHRVVKNKIETIKLAPILDLVETSTSRKKSTDRSIRIQNINMGDTNYIGGDAPGAAMGRGNRIDNNKSFNTAGLTGTELSNLLSGLKNALAEVRPEMRVKDATAVDAEIIEFEKEATQADPNKEKLVSSGKSLIEKVKTVGDVAGPAIGIVETILKLCTGS